MTSREDRVVTSRDESCWAASRRALSERSNGPPRWRLMAPQQLLLGDSALASELVLQAQQASPAWKALRTRSAQHEHGLNARRRGCCAVGSAGAHSFRRRVQHLFTPISSRLAYRAAKETSLLLRPRPTLDFHRRVLGRSIIIARLDGVELHALHA